ncbi:MAG: hypothetical protein AAF940_01015 [Pseudomonadota bacterium]
MASQLSVAVNRKSVAQDPDKTQKLRLLRGKLRKLTGGHEGFDDEIAQLEKRRERMLDGHLALGHAAFDAQLQGGIPWRGVTEIHAAAARDTGSVSGFVCALFARHEACADEGQKAGLGPVLWIAQNHVVAETGRPYGWGIKHLGFDADRLRFVSTARLDDALWVCEEAAATRALGGVVLDLRAPENGPDLRETRRLHMRAMRANVPLFLLRQGGGSFASVAPVRLDVRPAPSRPATLFTDSSFEQDCVGSIGPPGFGVMISRNKAGPAGNSFTLHWNSHERVFFRATVQNRTTGFHTGSTAGAAHGNSAHQPHRIAASALSGNGSHHAPKTRRAVAHSA